MFSANMDLKRVDIAGIGLDFRMEVFVDKTEAQSRGIHHVPKEFFLNNKKLEYVDFSNNFLSNALFFEQLSISEKLTKISLANNRLSDLNVEDLIEKNPNLQTLELHGNEFWCERLEFIYAMLDEKEIFYHKEGGCIYNSDTWEELKNLRDQQKKLLPTTPTSRYIQRRFNKLHNCHHNWNHRHTMHCRRTRMYNLEV